MKLLLKPAGTITMEFPHLQRLMEENQFDRSITSTSAIFRSTRRKGVRPPWLTLFDVEELATHGGSIRIFARHTEDPSRPVSGRATALLEREVAMA